MKLADNGRSNVPSRACAVILAVSLTACGRGTDNVQRATPSNAAPRQTPAQGQQPTAPAPAAPASPNTPQSPDGSAAPAAAGAPTLASSAQTPAALASGPPHTDNLVALDMGGHVERGNGLSLGYATFRLLDGDPKTAWSSEMNARFPHEIVLSFLGHDTALVAGVTLTLPPLGVNPTAGICADDKTLWAKDVEIWTSMDSPAEGFRKVATTSLPMEPGEHPVAFPAAVEAKYVKLVITSNHGCAQFTELGDVAVTEGRAPGYSPFLARHADLAALLSTGPAANRSTPPLNPPPVVKQEDPCALPAAVPGVAPAYPESRNVLIISDDPERYAPYYYVKVDPESPRVRYFPTGPGDGRVDSSILRRVVFWAVQPNAVNPAMLVSSSGIDTVAVAQVCDIKTSLSDAAKRAIVNWVAEGHKLILQDSDICPGPDYSFLPFPFATNNPGAKGAPSQLNIVENNLLVSARPTDPSYLDEESWRLEKNGNGKNDLGDSNTVVKYDSHWCGALTGTNANASSGFVLTYAHHGRGVILYDGLDYDQRRSVAYRQYVLRQLLLPFGPDNLPCSVPLGPFVITTDASLVSRPLGPGQVSYPITVVSNRGAYQGSVRLSFLPPAALRGVIGRFDPDTVTLGNEAKSTLTLTLPAPLPDSWRMGVRGEAPDAQATLCLAANLRRTGHLAVSSDLGSQAASPSRKNLLIVLDLSGSMNLPLGTSTRIATARQVLRDVLKQIPEDFNVGLRAYGHRYGSRQKETCTDSELVVPVRRLDRDAILKNVDRFRPRGETPLVYSVLQATSDLKGVGGGSVVLITDGEESCGGDFARAASTIHEAGVDFRLSIVGFTLTGAQAQRQLATLSSSTGGAYYAAQDGPALARALVAATISRFPYSVFDASGAIVGTGEAGDQGQELASGEYRLVVQAGDEKLAIDHIAIAAGAGATVRVVRKGDRFALSR